MAAQKTRSWRLYPADWLVILYSALMVALILLLGRPLSDYVDELAAYSALAAMATLIGRFLPVDGNRLTAFFRWLYPALLFGIFYRLTGGLMFLAFDRFLDYQLVSFEAMLLGFNPTLMIDRHLLSVWANELFSFCYFMYYPMMPAFLIPVFVIKDYDVIRRTLATVCLTFFTGYLLFFLYPVEGPRWYFANEYTHEITGPVFRQMVSYIIAEGAVRGGAMPSTHTGVAMVYMFYCFKHYRPWGWVLLPIVTGLAIGTVWGRFHYASDAVVGAAIAVFSFYVVEKYYPRFEPDKYKNNGMREAEREYVS